MIDLAGQLTTEAARPDAGDVTRRGEYFLERGHRTVERIRGEVGSAIVEPLGNGTHRIEGSLMLLVGGDLGIKHAVATAHDGSIVDAEREAQTWRNVVQVVRQIAGEPGKQRYLLRVDAKLHVVTHAVALQSRAACNKAS